MVQHADDPKDSQTLVEESLRSERGSENGDNSYPSDGSVISQATKQFAIRAVAITSIGGLLFGYDIGVIAGALKQLSKDLDLDHVEQGLVVSMLYIGYIFGSLGGGVADQIGRKYTILCVDLVFIFGASLLAFAQDLGTMDSVLCVYLAYV